MDNQLTAAGFLLIVLALLHLIFPKYFNWKKELQHLSTVNRQMMVIHTFFITLVLLLMGLLCISSSESLISTALGKTISLGFAVFWTIRFAVQFLGYSKTLWKGKKFETTIHVLFSLLWVYLSLIFWLNYFT
jgi:hypothetical protein